MYNKITVISGDIEELCNHLDMNGYNFERINQNLYVDEEETDYVETIMADHDVDYLINDEMEYPDYKLEKLWDDLEDVPFDENNEGEFILSEKWRHFPKGTEREDIWRFFDEQHSQGVVWLMYDYC